MDDGDQGAVQFSLYRLRFALLVHGDGGWQQLGITLIPAYSPEARGGSERVFRTRQDDCPKRAGSTEMAAASRYLAAQCLPAYHPRSAGPASEAGTAFVP